MNYQKQTPEYILDVLKKHNVQFMEIDYFAHPETFASTAGPCGGIGGCAMSTFTVESYVCDQSGPTVYVCAGMYIFDNSRWEPFKRIKGQWKKLEQRITADTQN